MIVKDIFLRFEVPDEIAQQALSQGVFVEYLHENWLGTQLDWIVLLRSALFYDLGDPEKSKLIRKKVGIDKYTTTIISRSVEKRLDEIIAGHDWYQKIILLSTLYRDPINSSPTLEIYTELSHQLEEMLINPIPSMVEPSELSRKLSQNLLLMDIKHYKNPSV